LVKTLARWVLDGARAEKQWASDLRVDKHDRARRAIGAFLGVRWVVGGCGALAGRS